MFFFPPFPSFPCSDGNAISEPAAVQANPGHLMYSHAVHLGVGAHISIRQAHTHTHTHAQARIFHGIPHSAFELPLCAELPAHGKKKMQSLLCTCSISKVLQRVRTSESPSPVCSPSKRLPPPVLCETSIAFLTQLSHNAKRRHVSQNSSRFLFLF